MKESMLSWSKYGRWVFLGVGMALAIYWLTLLRLSLTQQYADNPAHLAGFVRWLLGYVVLFATLGLLGVLNYRLVYRRLAHASLRWYYRAWLLVLWWLGFEWLQWRTAHDTELVEENLLVSALGVGLVMVVAGLLDAAHSRRERLVLLQQKTAAELTSLRAQLNPHFLFNALNTLYSEALVQNQEKLSYLIGELAGILRFSLQQAQQPQVSIGEEIDFLQRYLHLQEARLADNPDRRLSFYFHWDQAPAQLAPLLLIPFVENAFLYGLHVSQPCFITLDFSVADGQLKFSVANSICAVASHRGAGLGIANTRQRLQLLYPDRHDLQLTTADGVFTVSLHLRLTASPGVGSAKIP